MDKNIIEEIRLNKYLSQCGICSRREADRLIEEKRVLVDGRIAVSGEKVTEGQEVSVDGKVVSRQEKEILLLFYKPRGIVCTAEKRKGQTNIEEFLNYSSRVTYVGRLDKESEGLLLLTNCGDIINKIMRSGNCHEKEYEVCVNKEITDSVLKKMAEGVPILDTVTRPCVIRRTGKRTFRIILTQGLNRQIRRMCEYFGYKVTSLKRVRIMNFHLGNLSEGAVREATAQEWEELRKAIRHSSNTTVKESGGVYGESDIQRDARTDSAIESGIQSILPGRQRNHEQQRIRRSLRQAGGIGKKDRDHSGRKSDRTRRL